MWRVLVLAAVLWPSRLSGVFDGPPLDTGLEAVTLGLIVPVLAWAHPAFLRRLIPRAIILAILALKIGAALTLQQEGWCVTFAPPKPMVRDSTGKPHAWDPRADWLADDPVCSAIMTRSYRDTRELPVWFYNLPPPGNTPYRGGYGIGEIPVRETVLGFLDVPEAGTLELITGPATGTTLVVDGRLIEAREAGRHEVALASGTHLVQLDATLLSKQWPLVPIWNGREMGSMRFPAATVGPPSWRDRLARPVANWLLAALCATLVGWWLAGFVGRLRDPSLVAWAAAASSAVSLAAVYTPSQAPWHAAAVLALSSLIVVRDRYRNLLGAFMVIGVPWLAYAAAANLYQVGRWTVYEVGNDNFLFQRYSYRVFLQHYWLEGGQLTFWNQPFYRWIAGALHMVFGESSVGQVYFDAAGIAIMALFAYHVIARAAGFAWGIVAALLPLAMFLLGPTLEFVGFGLSEIASASMIYLAAFFVMRVRTANLVTAGVLVIIAFYTRLNNLPMALAVAAFALPVTMPASALWRPRIWLPLVRWRVVFAISAALALGAVLFAWRTWYYTGVFDVFHGTQREFLAVWKPGMPVTQAIPAMASSVMMVLTAADPPAFTWHGLPMLVATAIAVGALFGLPGFGRAPLPIVAFFLAGVAGALVTRGWGHEGRFSIHLFGAASVLCTWAAASAIQAMRPQSVWYAAERLLIRQ
jgi:hypothetical protein